MWACPCTRAACVRTIPGITGTIMRSMPCIRTRGGFCAENVIQPAYQLNYAPLYAKGTPDPCALVTVDQPNIIIETVKPVRTQNAL